MDIRGTLCGTESGRRDYVFGLCVGCPHNTDYEEDCPFKKLRDECEDEKVAILSKINSLPQEEIDKMVAHHYNDCIKNK